MVKDSFAVGMTYFKIIEKNWSYHSIGEQLDDKMIRQRFDKAESSFVSKSFIDSTAIEITFLDSLEDGYLSRMQISSKSMFYSQRNSITSQDSSKLVLNIKIGFYTGSLTALNTIDSLCYGDIELVKSIFLNMGVLQLNSGYKSFEIGKVSEYPIKIESEDHAGGIITMNELLTKKVLKVEDGKLILEQHQFKDNDSRNSNTQTNLHIEGIGKGFEVVEIESGYCISTLESVETSWKTSPKGEVSVISFIKEIVKSGHK
ncbi:MAG: hypothetical protein ACKVOR_12780 [Flavobacteriales bacterium]